MAATVPPKPSEFKAVIVLPTDTLPQAFVKVFLRFPVLFLRWFKSVYNDDGTYTDDFKQRVCNSCPTEDLT